MIFEFFFKKNITLCPYFSLTEQFFLDELPKIIYNSKR